MLIILATIFTTLTMKHKSQLVELEQLKLAYDGDMAELYNERMKNVPNKPVLKSGMTPIKWEGTTEISTTEDDEYWYKYVAGDNELDTKASNWANVKLSDGSYFVWIPRYEYKIVNHEHESETGKIDVKFIPTTQTTPDEGYKIHPAFTSNSEIGGWNSELSGIWVAKFEMSMETNGEHTETSSTEIGDVLTSNTVKMVSKPNVSSWRNIRFNNIFLNSYNYNRSLESHLIKGTEWGCITYLAHSQYGRNGHEIDKNNSSASITGNGGGEINAAALPGISYDYTTLKGQQASTTGNIYGIFDMSGGAFEFISYFLKKVDYGSTIESADLKYKQLSDGYSSNIYGDAIYETSTLENEMSAWNNDYSGFPDNDVPYLIRSGSFSAGIDAGLFYFNAYSSYSARGSFRIVLC